ncbi:MAG TPA: alkaline phosphatase family protein, partial [Thermoanaerobaculia bacterium]|nr:alkaline phosphatase family protein [Thermoanaerobaculia bacterium]
MILLSLDGTSAIELRERLAAGDLPAGGFSRFFEQGETAKALIPVDPTLTAVNHIALATGFPPAATGIVGNSFHAARSAWGEKESGFDAPIATETLWEAARRQGKRTG